MPGFNYLPPDEAFLDPHRPGVKHPEKAKAVIIPFGLETSLTFEGGTSFGPEALLKASKEVELFDEDYWAEAINSYEAATLSPCVIENDHAAALTQIEQVVGDVIAANRFPLSIGGEHSLSIGAVRPFAKKYADLAILHFDAHADLRDGYQGNPFSHASAMRRVVELYQGPLVSAGLRNISAEEASFYSDNKDRIHLHFAKDIKKVDLSRLLAPLQGRPVYVTFDVDCFDSSVMPATGTPEPGGLFWADVMDVLRGASRISTIVGADIVELSPRASLHACDFLTAKLAYKLLSFALYEGD